MLEIGKKYKKHGITYEVVDYVYYNGTNEHGFTFNVDGQIKKETIKDNNLDLFLNDFNDVIIMTKYMTEKKYDVEIIEENKNYKKMQDILLSTIEGVKNGSIENAQGKAIADIAQVLINSVKVEKLLK